MYSAVSTRRSHRRHWAVAALVTAAAAIGGCPTGTPRPVPETTMVALQLVASGLVSPVGMATPDDGTGRLFVLDQVGQIRIIDANAGLLPTPFLDLSDRMVTVGIQFPGGLVYDERGLLGLAFHPQYATNGRFFVFYTAPKGPDQPSDFNSETHVSEFHVSAVDPNRGDASSERILLKIGKPQFNHNGGQLAFGPDGYLYLSTGDGGGADDNDVGHAGGNANKPPDALGNGQDKAKLLGKILRIDVDSGDPYGIPADNPLLGELGAYPEIWAYGLRNPWRFSFDAGGGHRLFCADVGQNLFEEVNLITKGGNYGWHIKEGAHCFDAANPGTPGAQCPSVGLAGEPLIDPILEYPHTDSQGRPVGLAVVGGFVYRGSAIAGLLGAYVFGDLSTAFQTGDGTLFAADEATDGTWTKRELTIAGASGGRLGKFIFGFGQDGQGELYVLTSDNVGPVGTTGKVYRIVPAP